MADNTTTTSTDDVVEIIRQQHDTIRSLFSELINCPPDARAESFEPLVRLLAVHETAEEEIVYPALRARGDTGASVADARMQEEDLAKKTLAELEKMDPTTQEFADAIAGFQRSVDAHATREEMEVLPLLEMQTDERRQSMAKAFTLAESMAPTHAHKAAPESATGNMLMGPFVAMVDRVRDAIHDSRANA